MDENHLSKRLGRYLSVGRSATGFAGRYAFSKAFQGESGQEQMAEALYGFLANLRGPLVKAAQLIAMIPDLMPEPYAEKLMALQADAPPMNKLFVRRRMRNELGLDWALRFQQFDDQAVAAASLGQVHKAVSLDGEALACKLQYPDMQSVVEADLAQLKLLFSLYKRTNPGLDHQEVFKEIEDHLMKELDYTLEAQNLRTFQQFFEGADYVTVPKVYEELSTPRLLTMSWLEGTPMHAVKEFAQEEKNTVARNLFQTWYTPFYQAGLLHGDPHMGNYRVTESHAIALYDFGCVRVFDERFVQGNLELYHALKEGDAEREVEAYKLWGFEGLSKGAIDALHHWSTYLYGPLLEDRVRPIDETFSSQKGRDVAAQVAQKLRESGGIQVPRTFVFMDRSAIGLGSVFMHLRAELNWHQLFETLIARRTPLS